MTTASPSTAASELQESIDVLVGNRVRAYFEAREAANSAPAPDPDDPDLAATATGAELEAVTASTQRRLDEGLAIRPGEAQLAFVRVSPAQISEGQALVTACSVDDGVVFEVSSGDVINDDVITHNYRIKLLFEGGEWKVAQIERIQQWEGVAGCALAPDDFPF